VIETEADVSPVHMEGETKGESYFEKMEGWLHMGDDDFCYVGDGSDSSPPHRPKIHNTLQAITWPQGPPKVSLHGYTQNSSTRN